jgi:hypothetical protein
MDGFSLHQIEKMTDIKESLFFFKKLRIFLPIIKKLLISILHCLQKAGFSGTLNQWIFGNKEDLFIEEGAQIEFSTINTKQAKSISGKMQRKWKAVTSWFDCSL